MQALYAFQTKKHTSYLKLNINYKNKSYAKFTNQLKLFQNFYFFSSYQRFFTVLKYVPPPLPTILIAIFQSVIPATLILVLHHCLQKNNRASLVAQTVQSLPAMRETRV